MSVPCLTRHSLPRAGSHNNHCNLSLSPSLSQAAAYLESLREEEEVRAARPLSPTTISTSDRSPKESPTKQTGSSSHINQLNSQVNKAKIVTHQTRREEGERRIRLFTTSNTTTTTTSNKEHSGCFFCNFKDGTVHPTTA